MIHVRWILTAVAVVAIAACASDSIGSPQGGGSLVLRLTTPHGDDGALTFELSGPSISTQSTARPGPGHGFSPFLSMSCAVASP